MQNVFMYLLDIALIVWAAFTIFRCWKDGFAVSVIRFARVFIALIGSIILVKTFKLSILMFLVCFIVLFVAVTVLMKILKLVTKIPVIHGIDKLLGLLLGIVCAFLTLYVIFWIFRGVAYVYDLVSGGVGGAEFFLGSRVFRFIGKIAGKLF